MLEYTGGTAAYSGMDFCQGRSTLIVFVLIVLVLFHTEYMDGVNKLFLHYQFLWYGLDGTLTASSTCEIGVQHGSIEILPGVTVGWSQGSTIVHAEVRVWYFRLLLLAFFVLFWYVC